ncbi:hypothetical protein Hanom_Chr06g00572821 [Helianthus anomalus]
MKLGEMEQLRGEKQTLDKRNETHLSCWGFPNKKGDPLNGLSVYAIAIQSTVWIVLDSGHVVGLRVLVC